MQAIEFLLYVLQVYGSQNNKGAWRISVIWCHQFFNCGKRVIKLIIYLTPVDMWWPHGWCALASCWRNRDKLRPDIPAIPYINALACGTLHLTSQHYWLCKLCRYVGKVCMRAKWPISHSGRSLSRFPQHEATRSIFTLPGWNAPSTTCEFGAPKQCQGWENSSCREISELSSNLF